MKIKAKTFVTIFPLSTNIHLVKDVGQIPYFLAKKYNYTTKLVTYNCTPQIYISRNYKEALGIIDNSYSYLNSEVKGLNVEFIKDRGRKFGTEKSVFRYIIKNAKKIDILNLYHFNNETFFYSALFKFFNKKGKVYIKTDLNPNNAEKFLNNLSNSILKYSNFKKFLRDIILIRKFLFSEFLVKKYLDKIDLISFEINSTKEIFDKFGFCPQAKTFVLPNGFNHLVFEHIEKKYFNQKENIFLTVGRHGIEAKNTYFVLNIIPEINIDNWKFIFAGSITDELSDFIIEYYAKYPYLKEKVIFTGDIKNRDALIEIYNKSKVFFMTSLREGFPLVLPEAVYYGNYLLLSNKIAVAEIFLNQNKGETFSIDNCDDFRNKIENIIQGKTDIEKTFTEAEKTSADFTWDKIILTLQQQLEEK